MTMTAHDEGAPQGASKVSPPIPEISDADKTFGNIKHMPKYYTLPEEFQRGHGPYCDGVSGWFYAGASRDGADLIVEKKRFRAKPGVDADKALRAIGAILRSFEPKQEHKIGGAGYLLSRWFDLIPATQSPAVSP